jgi:cytochrome c-type biogenesis protein CcmH/NrfG
MKKLILLIAILASGLVSQAQTNAISAKDEAKNLERADTAFAHKNYQDAYTGYQSVISYYPNNTKILNRMGYILSLSENGNTDAIAMFNKALSIQPNNPVSNYYLGVIYIDKAKQSKDINTKSDFKAKAALYLQRAISYGSEDAKAAERDLNSI